MRDWNMITDVHVCKPNSGITASLKAVFVQFEVMDKDTLEGSGTLHTLAMTTADAMWLLKNLQYMQARFDLPIPDGPVVDATPGKTELAGLLTPRAPQVRVRAR
jgi:hypothetical protein